MTNETENGALDGHVVEDGEVARGDAPPLPPENGSANNWLALISNYTERPDLFLAEVEKHDPGFVAKMNKDSQERAEINESARFKFSRTQAYTSLALLFGAGAAIIITIVVATLQNGASFWQIIALGIVFAITQGGSFGFEKIIEAVAHLMGRAPRE